MAFTSSSRDVCLVSEVSAEGSHTCSVASILDFLGLPRRLTFLISGSFTFSCFVSDSFTSDSFTSDSFTSDSFTSCSFTSGSFTLGSITSGSFTSGSFTSGLFTSGSLVSVSFVSGSFTLGPFTSGSLVLDFLTSGTVISGSDFSLSSVFSESNFGTNTAGFKMGLRAGGGCTPSFLASFSVSTDFFGVTSALTEFLGFLPLRGRSISGLGSVSGSSALGFSPITDGRQVSS